MDVTLSGQAPDADPLRAYSPAEELALTRNLELMLASVHRGHFMGERHGLSLLCTLHELLFRGVRAHAGRIRRRAYGSERLTFGPHRSAHRDEVEDLLAELFQQLERSLRSLAENQADPAYERSVFHIAVWAHARIIRIHPFEDGNGRTSRAFPNAVLVRQGLRPVAMEATREEYLLVLNHFFLSGHLDPLLDLVVRLADEQLGSI